ncbi:MAG TPA: alpha/beta fold hydrolase [Amycolatopsis sp.]|nr:alpha/beta fold hydrolase [Amycolatopsis sp.]
MDIAASLHLPEDPKAASDLIFAIPGGGYTKSYWHSPKLAEHGYSFAERLTGRGFAVLGVDVLGTGASSRPANADDLSLRTLAAANDAVARQVRERGVGGLPASARMIGVGHSMGGAALIVQQGVFGSFDAIGVLGFTNQFVKGVYQPHEREAELTPEERTEWARAHVPQSSWGRPWPEIEEYFVLPRANLRSWFHLPDVPDWVVELEEAEATVSPRTVVLESVTPSSTASAAAEISSPVFLAFGEQDVSPDIHVEVQTYPKATDVTTFLLAGSAHCHNYATSRTLLWDRIAGWIRSLPA